MQVVRNERTAEAMGSGDDERTITILVIARSATVRAGIAALIEADRRFAVAGSFANLAEAAGELEGESPHVTLIESDKSDGVFSEELDELTGSQSEVEIHRFPVIVLMADLQTERIINLLQRGARAVLPRDSTSTEILAAIEAVAAGLVVVHPDALDALHTLSETNNFRKSAASSPVTGEQNPTTVEQLTPREVEVLGMLAEGLGNKEIAWRMQISEHTVKFHVSSIFGKLGVGSRTEAVTLGLRRGLIML